MPSAMARHILVKQKEKAEELKARISSGESFEKIAKKYSECNSSKQGGDLGEILPGQLVKPVEQVIFKKSLKTIHGPIKSKFGFHLIEIYFRD